MIIKAHVCAPRCLCARARCVCERTPVLHTVHSPQSMPLCVHVAVCLVCIRAKACVHLGVSTRCPWMDGWRTGTVPHGALPGWLLLPSHPKRSKFCLSFQHLFVKFRDGVGKNKIIIKCSLLTQPICPQYLIRKEDIIREEINTNCAGLALLFNDVFGYFLGWVVGVCPTPAAVRFSWLPWGSEHCVKADLKPKS